MKIYTIIILIFFYSFNAWAAPSGISISGDFSDGGTATITGNGFGSGSEQDFLGGIDGNINTGTTGNYFTPRRQRSPAATGTPPVHQGVL